ncbi:MAG TPA: hypothetical protein VGL57_10955 [Solirubrobacteraceae bacterium]|jgi:hypothetical protein
MEGPNQAIRVAAVIRRTFRIYVDQAPVLMPAAAVVFAISGVLGSVLIASSPGLASLALVIRVLALALFTGMIVELVADVQDGRRDTDVARLLQAVRPVLGRLILVGLAIVFVVGLLLTVGVLSVLALAIGSALKGGNDAAGTIVGGAVGVLLFLIPALYLLTVWSVAIPIVVLERPGGLLALGRSRALVRGNGWRVFWVNLLLVILLGVAGAAVGLLAYSASASLGLVVTVVVGVLTAPISALAEAVLYFELRAARDRGEADHVQETGAFQAGPFPPAAP